MFNSLASARWVVLVTKATYGCFRAFFSAGCERLGDDYSGRRSKARTRKRDVRHRGVAEASQSAPRRAMI